MHSHQISGHRHQGRPRPGPGQAHPSEGMVPLHRLSNICCSSGACSDVDYWPMDYPQEGWLQLDVALSAAVPVNLSAFSSRGVGIILKADVALQQGAKGMLLTQAHGAGLSHRPVRCCWHRPHPQDPDRQCAGLRFEPHDNPCESHASAADF
jgi:hypothetical protein